MPSRPELKLDWCDHKAAEYAVMHWHYSRCMPAGKLMKVGVWEGGRYVGCLLYGRGANNNMARPYGLEQIEACELVRIALGGHATPVSRLMAISLRFLRAANPGLRLVISYADPDQGHHGGIYQAGGWVYVGTSEPQERVIVDGRAIHMRSASSRFGSIKGLEMTKAFWKHKYLMPLDEEMRRRVVPLSKPYPKRAKQANEGVQPECGGAAPTRTLQELTMVL